MLAVTATTLTTTQAATAIPTAVATTTTLAVAAAVAAVAAATTESTATTSMGDCTIHYRYYIKCNCGDNWRFIIFGKRIILLQEATD